MQGGRRSYAAGVRTSDEPSSATTSPLRERLLQAALDALRELDVVGLLTAVGTREIARRAEGSAASIYHHYGSLEGLAEAVVARVYDPRLLPTQTVVDDVARIARADYPLQATLALAGAEHDRLTTDADFSLRMGLWAFGGPEAHERYRAYLRTVDDQLIAVAGALFAQWGRELRPPFDLPAYLATRVAFLNGSTLRHHVEPGVLTREQYQRAAVSIDLVVLHVPGDRHDVDGRLAEINYFPRTDAGPSVPVGDHGRTTHARILNAAGLAFAQRGLAESSLSQIATAAGVSPSTLRRYYGTKQALAVALFRQQAHDLLPAVRPERDADARTVLRDHLAAIGGLVPPRTPQAGAYLADLLVSGEADHLVVSVEQRLDGLVADGRDRTEAARVLLGLVVRACLTHPARPPAENVDGVLDLMLPGLSRPAR